MLDFVTKGLSKILGNKNDKDLKIIRPYVGKINTEFEKLSSITDNALRARTQELKNIIAEKLSSIDKEMAGIRTKVQEEGLDIHQKEALFDELDKLEKDRDTALEVVLLEILPQAFAVVKETARRLKENKQLVVEATLLDKTLAAESDYVEIQGSDAVWKNEWSAAGVPVVWDMVHYDVQLIGGVVLHEGKIAEMTTGEGKTLVATLPAYLNALAGRGVHIVTVNDYLAKRDSEWMRPIFAFHGMRVDCIDKYPAHSQQRRNAYNCDITYGTNNEFGFDYLRDNMSMKPEELVQRKHHFAMIDEVDSVLIDDARTPLIISGPVPKGDQHEFYDLKPRIARIVEEQRKMTANFLTEAKKKIAAGDTKAGGLSLFRAFRGLPKHKPLIKYLGEPGMRTLLQKIEDEYLAENQKRMPEADAPLFFTIDEKTNSIELTDKGIELITGDGEDPHFFILPDIGVELDKIEKSGVAEEDIVQQKDALIKEYSAKSQRIHSVNQLLKAYTLFEKDTEYVVMNSKVMIVDEQTGRIMDGRRYSDGLHQAIEAKENVKVEDATQTYATVTLQNYFRMYHKLSGMTGTAETEAGEFWEIYKLDVVVIPTNRPIARDDRHDLVYKTVREKFNAVIDEIGVMVQQGRPVLVGTTSVEISEVISRMLKMRNINHNVLNAKQHKKEADIVAEAGKSGTVTIATNMAGRGTDIKLSPESKAAGGLAIIGTERHESRRVDRQLRGRAGRQGDVGSSQFFVSLEDNLMRLFMPERIARLMDKIGLREGEVIQHSMITSSIERAQKKVEENNFAIRKRLLEYDDVMNQQREVVYKRRRNALYGERLELDIMNILYDVCDDFAENVKATKDVEQLQLSTIGAFGYSSKLTEQEVAKDTVQTITDKLFDEAMDFYNKKNDKIVKAVLPVMKDVHANKGATIENVSMPFVSDSKQIRISANLNDIISTNGQALLGALQKSVSLAIVDQGWTSHLREMDDLKQAVHNASYEQKDPLLIYKFEGFKLFKTFVGEINHEVISFLMKATLPENDPAQIQEAREAQQRKLSENKNEAHSLLNGGGQPDTNTQTEKQVIQPMKSTKMHGRNDRVSVQYIDGSLKKDVKFKTVEQDVLENKCVLVEDEA